jgi:hypothetical protein
MGSNQHQSDDSAPARRRNRTRWLRSGAAVLLVVGAVFTIHGAAASHPATRTGMVPDRQR